MPLFITAIVVLSALFYNYLQLLHRWGRCRTLLLWCHCSFRPCVSQSNTRKTSRSICIRSKANRHWSYPTTGVATSHRWSQSAYFIAIWHHLSSCNQRFVLMRPVDFVFESHWLAHSLFDRQSNQIYLTVKVLTTNLYDFLLARVIWIAAID